MDRLHVAASGSDGTSVPAEPRARVHVRRVVIAAALGVPAAIIFSEVSRNLFLWRMGHWPSQAVSAGLILLAAASAGLIVLRMHGALVEVGRYDRETEGKYRALVANIPGIGVDG